MCFEPNGNSKAVLSNILLQPTPPPSSEVNDLIDVAMAVFSASTVLSRWISLCACSLRALMKYSLCWGGFHLGLVMVKCIRDNSVLPSSACWYWLASLLPSLNHYINKRAICTFILFSPGGFQTSKLRTQILHQVAAVKHAATITCANLAEWSPKSGGTHHNGRHPIALT